ncbi:MAG: hypothetical protein CL676_08325 [Bdellovibrionaceae bacterium]|nr:hypothetical protein [Pseudobdellovibrionaceae bacterium]|tara:strand:- start:1099 stop:1872 length:774 start_codon:yes stop_codon:yes gene_type:complete
MKKTLTLMFAALSLALNVSCGNKSDDGGGATATTPTDTTTTVAPPAPTPDFQCEHWQVYHASYGCLAPRNCPSGYGFYNNTCVPGQTYSAIPSGEYDAAIPVVNAAKFQELMIRSGSCRGYSSSYCITPTQIYAFIRIAEGNYQTPYLNGVHMGIQGVLGSSFFGVQMNSRNGGGARMMSIFLNAYNGATSGFSLQRSAYAYPTADGFTANVRGLYATRAVDEQLLFKFSPTDVSRNGLHMTITYQGVVIAKGTITK